MAERATRIDRIQLRDGGVLSPEGYLDVDAYLARDGVLRYSDGIKSWNEYRPRAELDAAAASWLHKPVTDDHPPVMVDATNAREYARGMVVSEPRIVEADGVAYLAARLRVTDAALVSKIQGGQRELSIGFMADVQPEQCTAPSGERCDAVQRRLEGNHVASVQRGRAGPAVRVLLDSAQTPIPVCYDAGATAREVQHVSTPNLDSLRPMRTIKIDTAAKFDAVKAWAAHAVSKIKADEVGLPTTMAKLVGPDGTEIEVPTWVAALVAEALDAHKAGQAAEAPAEPMAEAEGEPAPKPEDPNMPAKPDDKIKPAPPMTPDAVHALVRRRARLELLGAAAGMPAAIFDADDQTLARAYVAHVTPHAKAIADKSEGAALDALVECAAAAPRKAEPVNPFEVPTSRGDADKPEDDPIVAQYAAMLS
jgi:hypothetical protein